MSTDTLDDWFPDYVRYHHAVLPSGWPSPTEEDFKMFINMMKTSFRRAGVHRKSDAWNTLNAMVASDDPPRMRGDHISKFLAKYRQVRANAMDAELRKANATMDAAQLQAAQASADCPECDGRGWARRKAHWLDGFTISQTLFCRCDHGRWLFWHHEETVDGVRRPSSYNFVDLQAHPELWRDDLDHDTWSDEPTEDTIQADPETAGRWYFLKPGEPAPRVRGFTKSAREETPRTPAPIPEYIEPTAAEAERNARKAQSLRDQLLVRQRQQVEANQAAQQSELEPAAF